MNKIYKIVWSKIRNTWVVASEISKGHGKSSSSEGNGKLLKSLVLTALLGSFMTAGMSPVAATLTPEQQAVYNAVLKELENKGVHYVSVKGESQDNKSNYKNDGAKGKGAVAIGENALAAKGGTVSIGRNAHIEGNGGNTSGEGSVAIGDNSLITTNGLDLASIAIGKNAKVLNGSGKQERVLSFMPDNYTNGDLPDNADKSAGGIAIGTNSYARTGSIQLGHHTFAGYKMGGIDVTKANEEANIVGMTTVGTNTYNKGALANMYGAYSIITGSFTGAGGFNSLSYGSQNFGANVVGSLNSIRSKGHSGSSGIANSIVGVANTVENANGTLVYGAGNKVTNSIASIGAPSTFLGSPTWDKMVESLQKGIKDSKSGGAVLAIGGGNVADYVRHSQLVGVNNTVTGTENKVSEFNMVNGYQNTATNITHVTMIGSENQVTDTKNALVFGDKRKLTKANGSVVIGVSDTVKEIKVEDVTVIGHNALAEGANAVAIGRGASADSLSTVAIGDEARVSSDTNLSGGVAIGKKSNVINGNGRQEKYLGFGTLNDPQRSATGVAIGAYSFARTGSIQIGAHTYLGKMGGIEVTDGTNGEANHINQTTVGTNTFNKGIFGTMIGAYSISTGSFTAKGGMNSLRYGSQNFGSTVVGSLNTIQSKGHTGSAGISNSIVGLANVTENTNGTLIFGAGNKVTNSIKSISGVPNGVTSGAATPDELIEKLRQGTIDSESGGSTMVIGGGNTADYTRASQIMGVNNTLTGTKDKESTYNLVDGFKNKAENVTHVTMIGSDNKVQDTTGAVLLGDKRKLTGADGSIVLGSADESAETTVKDATVIGHNANTTVAGGVALGAESKAITDKGSWGVDVSKNAAMTADALLGDKKAEYDAAKTKLQTLQEEEQNLAKLVDESQKNDPFNWTKNKELKEQWEEKQKEVAAQVIEVNNYVKTWQSTEAAVSVGDTDKGITRQITGVAAGTEDTDAVNVAQLKALSTKVDNGTVHYYSVTSDKKVAGSNYDNDGAKATDSMVIGIGSTSEGINSTVIGNNNKLTGNKSLRRNEKEVKINNSIVAGHNLEIDGYCNSVLATDYEDDTFHGLTKVEGDYNTVLGAGNVVGYALKNKGIDYIYTKLDENIISNNNVVIGTRQTVSGSDNVVLGHSTEFELGEDEETKQITTADQVTAIGTGNLIKSKAREGVAIGNHLGINGPQTIAIGFGSEANAQSAISIGQSNTAEGKNAISIGNQSHAYAKNSVAIGGPSVTEGPPAEPGALATVENGVALGAGSVADRKAGMAGYLAGSKTTAKWKSTLGALSVGVVSDEWTDTRQITGVAAGTEDTDAVNVAQLKAVESKITQAGAGAQKHTSVTEGTNISVTEDGTNNEGGKNYKVSLAKDIDLGQDGSIKAGNTTINKDGVTTNTVKAGDTTINNDGLTIKDGPVITKTNVDVNNQQIHHVKDGTADDDAATVGQVNKKIDEITKTVAGSSVTGGTIGEDGKISLTKADKTTVELQGQLKDISARAGDYEIKDNKVTIGLEDNYSKNAAGNIVIKDVAKASALEQETKERKDADKVITETIGAANKDELKTAYQDTTYIKNSTTLVEADKALDKAIGKNAGDIKKNTETINILGKQVGNLDTRVNRVGAGAAALAALHPLDFDPDDKWDFAAGYGNYKGANAAAIGAYYRPNEDTMFSVGGSFGGGENMVNAGVSVKLGQGNHVSTSKVAMAKDMLAMQKRMAEMEAQMAKMQGFIGALTGVDTQTAMFPDVPENHWAYEYVKGLCEQGIIEGYPDGNFNGNRSMTRYEFAAMLYRALAKGVSLDARAVKEFAPELGRIRVDVISQNKEGQPVIERVRVNEEKKDK